MVGNPKGTPVAATRGPIPERSDQRRRRNVGEPIETVAPVAIAVEAPELGLDITGIARDWYDSLKTSGQSRYYEPSDWQTARLVAMAIAGYAERGGAETLKAIMSSMASLLATEGDRRRVRMEIDRSEPDTDAEDAKVAQMSRYRRKTNVAG